MTCTHSSTRSSTTTRSTRWRRLETRTWSSAGCRSATVTSTPARLRRWRSDSSTPSSPSASAVDRTRRWSFASDFTQVGGSPDRSDLRSGWVGSGRSWSGLDGCYNGYAVGMGWVGVDLVGVGHGGPAVGTERLGVDHVEAYQSALGRVGVCPTLHSYWLTLNRSHDEVPAA